MKDYVKKLFSDSPEASMMRLCQFMCTVVACTVAILTVVLGKDLYAGAALVSVLIAFSTGGKAIQKFAEIKGNTSREMVMDTRDGSRPDSDPTCSRNKLTGGN